MYYRLYLEAYKHKAYDIRDQQPICRQQRTKPSSGDNDSDEITTVSRLHKPSKWRASCLIYHMRNFVPSSKNIRVLAAAAVYGHQLREVNQQMSAGTAYSKGQ